MPISKSRLKIVDYFDGVINKIDLKSEVALLNQGKNETLVNTQRLKLIEKIKEIEKFNLASLVSAADEPFAKYCFLIEKIGLRDKINEPFGFLIILEDFSMSDAQFQLYTAFTEFFNNEKAFDANTADLFFHQPEFNSMQKARRVSMHVKSSFYPSQGFIVQSNRANFFRIQELRLKNVLIDSMGSNSLFLFKEASIEKLDLKYDWIESPVSIDRAFNTILTFQNECMSVKAIELTLNLIDLSAHDLNRISDLNVTTFQLHTSKLKFSQSSFAGFENLSELVLSNNKIERFESAPFARLSKLKKLSLNKSIIETVGSDLFQGLSSLEELILWGCKISSIEPNAFLGLPKLKVLCLNDNRLVKLEEETLNGLECVQELNLSTNRIKEIDMDTFSFMKNLKRLILSKNNIKEFQVLKRNGRLRRLEEISLSYNTIRSFKIEGLSALKKLNLSNNQIERIKAGSFADLSNLEALYFSFNRIRDIDADAFASLSQLNILDLYSNSMTTINKRTFGGLFCLKTLSMGNNSIGYVHPEAFDDLKQLSDFNANIAEDALKKYLSKSRNSQILA
jgi:Leucine-rich repeat (LRR) protein